MNPLAFITGREIANVLPTIERKAAKVEQKIVEVVKASTNPLEIRQLAPIKETRAIYTSPFAPTEGQILNTIV